jgi:hypothetical protein
MKDIEDNIKKVVTSLFDVFELSKKEEINNNYGDKIKELVSIDPSMFQDMEQFDLFIKDRINSIIEACLQVANPEFNSENINKLSVLYFNYNFFDLNLKHIVQQKEGSACCADKSGWLVEAYKKHIITNELPDLSDCHEHYWKPEFGTAQQWMNFCDGLYNLYYGNPIKYLQSMKELIEEENK